MTCPAHRVKSPSVDERSEVRDDRSSAVRSQRFLPMVDTTSSPHQRSVTGR
ncbi:hypothetical protein Ae168Ps1_2544 [Pseudonocardia sp. Ae168_Ps1]|nr:hypothetical protein Ae168Ps1_2544 [Pseudonocardia sp. Ae168_Ps1]OLL94236.1 hypothetical protein Ae356Ps1_4133 [Pseudonocardia sp. Ae356_Ps1]